MNVRGLDLDVATQPSLQDQRTRALVTTTLQRGVIWTSLLMVLPGLLSSRPVGDSLTGAAVGYSATLLVALGVYAWRSYVVPYRRVRALIDASR